MPICEACGNDYHETFQVMMNGQAHILDSFECAIKTLAHTGAHVSSARDAHTAISPTAMDEAQKPTQ